MGRIQIYADEDLQAKIDADCAVLGVNDNVLVLDILKKHYGLVPPDTLSDVEIEQRFFKELVAYVKGNPTDEFDLNVASATYRNIDMVYAGKPRILKATLGKKFAKRLGKDEFVNVEQVLINGKPKRTVGNRAAIYRIIESNTK